MNDAKNFTLLAKNNIEGATCLCHMMPLQTFANKKNLPSEEMFVLAVNRNSIFHSFLMLYFKQPPMIYSQKKKKNNRSAENI